MLRSGLQWFELGLVFRIRGLKPAEPQIRSKPIRRDRTPTQDFLQPSHYISRRAKLEFVSMESNRDAQDPQGRAGDGSPTIVEEAVESPPNVMREAYPTHRLKSVKAGVNGVQLFVSSKEHLYDIEDMEGGDHVWQAVGVWEDPTIQEGIRTLRQRQQDRYLPAKINAASDKEGVFGTGRKLGDFSDKT